MSASRRRPRDRQGEILSVFTIDKNDSGCPGPISPDLNSFLHPVGIPTFISDFYQKQRAFAIKVHPSLREKRLEVIKNIMHNFSPRHMLHSSNSAADGISVWMKPKVAADAGQPGGASSCGGNISSVKMQPDDAITAYKAGHGCYFRGSEDLESSFVSAYMQQLGFGAMSFFRDGARRGEVEVFATHVGHTTPPHVDFQAVNFTVQLRGRKAWSLAKTKNIPEFPTKAVAAHFITDDSTANLVRTQTGIHALAVETTTQQQGGGSTPVVPPAFSAGADAAYGEVEGLETVVLEAGDVLFHPAGVWHKVETLPCGDENSLSINMSLFPQSYGDLMTEVVQTMMMRQAHWRRPVSTLAPSSAATAAVAKSSSSRATTGPDAVRATLDGLLHSLRSELSEIDGSHILPEAVTQPERQGAPREVIVARFVPTSDEPGSSGFMRVAKWLPSSRKLQMRSRVEHPNMDLATLRLRRNPLAALVELDDALDVSAPGDDDDDEDDDESNDGEAIDHDDDDDDDDDVEVSSDDEDDEDEQLLGKANELLDDEDDSEESSSSDDDEEEEEEDGEFQDQDDFVLFDLTSNIAEAGAEQGFFGAPGIRTKIRVARCCAVLMRKLMAIPAGNPVTAAVAGFAPRTEEILHLLIALGYFSVVSSSNRKQ